MLEFFIIKEHLDTDCKKSKVLSNSPLDESRKFLFLGEDTFLKIIQYVVCSFYFSNATKGMVN